ncbi:MAG: hypothetical protein ACR2KX_03295 [Chitinophagaceae bacterium]
MGDKTLRELLPEFYKQYNLGADGGNNSASVKIEMTKNFALYFPNFAARKRAVLKHDIHHLVTNYPSTFKGEAEIGAWEIASGCKNYWVAWMLDMSGMMTGIIFNFWGVIKAFARGRRTKNLYYNIISTNQALDMKPGELQKALSLDKYSKHTKPSFIDLLVFAAWAAAGIIYSILSLVFLPFIIIYTIYIKLQKHLQH